MNAPRHRCCRKIFADYHQFYVWDLFTFLAHQAVANGTVTEVTMVQVATSIVAEGAVGA
jgi:hypothetical protein